jgi:cyclophilin family peptidyl-prolyl cis-trans isomerase
MVHYVRWISLLGLLSLALAAGWAGDAAVEPGPKGAEFDRRFSEWKGVLDQLRRLRDDYRGASPGKREEMPQQYGELVKQSEGMLPGLRAAAEAAYLEAPSIDSHPAEFLAAAMYWDCNEDSYEEAFRLGKMLLDHGFDQRGPAIYGWAGIAAFAAGEFEPAEKWLQLAKEKNVLTHLEPPWKDIGPAALRACPSCRQAWKKEEAIRAAEAKANKSPETSLPRVLLQTTKGDIELELFENEAPNTVANFVALVEGGAYNADPARRQQTGIPFYSVTKAQGVETGGYAAAEGKVRYLVLSGCDQPSRAHFRGSVTMTMPADGQGGGSSQFSILFFPLQSLNGTNTCFGRVVRGMEVLSRLQRINPEQFDVLEPDKILGAKVLSKRNHAYELRKPPAPKPESKPAPKPKAESKPKPAPKVKP